MIGPFAQRRSLNWPGAARPIPEEDIIAVVDGLDSETSGRLREIAHGFSIDEVSILIWLIEGSFPKAQPYRRSTHGVNVGHANPHLPSERDV